MSFQSSSTHSEAVEFVVTLTRTTRDISELMSSSHKRDKECAREMLQIIFISFKTFSKARPGNQNDVESNFLQLFKLRAEDHPSLTKWMERQTNRYTSHEIQDEILKIMSYSV